MMLTIKSDRNIHFRQKRTKFLKYFSKNLNEKMIFWTVMDYPPNPSLKIGYAGSKFTSPQTLLFARKINKISCSRSLPTVLSSSFHFLYYSK